MERSYFHRKEEGLYLLSSIHLNPILSDKYTKLHTTVNLIAVVSLNGEKLDFQNGILCSYSSMRFFNADMILFTFSVLKIE